MGKIKKIIGAFVHAPDRFDALAERIAEVSQLADERFDHADERLDSLQDQTDDIRLRVDDAEKRINESEPHFFDRLCEDRELLSRLNRGLSISPTVWGDPERLEIDETAAVFTCFFNTNSGRIKIGESTFAGSGVSLLAGSHDPQLTGFMRRDTETTEGCDIVIGKGVWLASGCTVLGPCTIGDNAVIAAGAVVTPGTSVSANTIWGGVPARQISQLEDKPMSADNPAVQRAYEHSGGMLFADGWGERIPGICEKPGHWMHKDSACLITDQAEWNLEYRKEKYGENKIRVTGPAGETEIVFTASEGKMKILLPVREGELGEVRLMNGTGEKVFMAWSRPGEAEETAEQAEEEGNVMTDTVAKEEAAVRTEGKLDIEKIMEEIRAEALKRTPAADLPEFAKISKENGRAGDQLKEQVKLLTDDYVIPVSYQDPSRNPLKRLYKKIMVKAVNCATAPMSVRMTETNLAMKTALEKAVEVIEAQEKRIAELEKKAE